MPSSRMKANSCESGWSEPRPENRLLWLLGLGSVAGGEQANPPYAMGMLRAANVGYSMKPAVGSIGLLAPE